DVSKFTSSKTELSLVELQVGTQDHADTVAKAALTKRAMEFITAEVEVQGNPEVKPGAMVNLKKVGEYSGHYYVTEANHFYDAAGYNCIFYVARDKWGDSSQTGGGGSGAPVHRRQGRGRGGESDEGRGGHGDAERRQRRLGDDGREVRGSSHRRAGRAVHVQARRRGVGGGGRHRVGRHRRYRHRRH